MNDINYGMDYVFNLCDIKLLAIKYKFLFTKFLNYWLLNIIIIYYCFSKYRSLV